MAPELNQDVLGRRDRRSPVWHPRALSHPLSTFGEVGTNNKQRRAAKAKRRAKTQGPRVDGRHHERSPFEPRLTPRDRARGLLEEAAAASFRGDSGYVDEAATMLTRLDARLVDQESEGALLVMTAQLWDDGWQPAEVIRHARRTEARAGRLVATAVAADHRRRAPSTMHPQWAAQIEALGLPAEGGATGWLAPFAAGEALDRRTLVSTVIIALGVLGGVGPLPTIVPPPGTTGNEVWADLKVTVDDPVLIRVRALLAQAESTTFEAEAETFTAKAQELMARHAIDTAVLWAQSERDERPITIRLPVDDPYSDIKSLLLQRVAHHSRCKSVYHPSYNMASVVGFASDIAGTETLYTSLLVQSQAALQGHATRSMPGGRARSRSFRSSFLMSFTQRIDERLEEINAFVTSAAAVETGSSLLPVLAARDDAIDEAVSTMFGSLSSNAVRGGTDAAGWAHGRWAADQARVNFGDLDAAALALGR